MSNEYITNQNPAEAPAPASKTTKAAAAVTLGALLVAGPAVAFHKEHSAPDFTTTTEFSAPQTPGLANVEVVAPVAPTETAAPVEAVKEKHNQAKPSPTDTNINVGGESGAIKFGKPEGEVKPGTHDAVKSESTPVEYPTDPTDTSGATVINDRNMVNPGSRPTTPEATDTAAPLPSETASPIEQPVAPEQTPVSPATPEQPTQ